MFDRIMKLMTSWYFRNMYQPIALDPQQPLDHPARHHLNSVPWISTWETVCQSTALQMIAAHHGIERPRRGERFDLSQIALGLEAGAATRPDNAAYLRGTFASRPDLRQAAGHFDQAAGCYQAALGAVADRGAGRAAAAAVAGWLRQAAAAERSAGQNFLAQA
jgi:hypothetical protein